jgi:hypothetical protein
MESVTDLKKPRSLLFLTVHDQFCSVGKFRQTLRVHAVIHKRAPTFCINKPHGAQYLQMMRNRRLPDRKMPDDIAHTDRIFVGSE